MTRSGNVADPIAIKRTLLFYIIVACHLPTFPLVYKAVFKLSDGSPWKRLPYFDIKLETINSLNHRWAQVQIKGGMCSLRKSLKRATPFWGCGVSSHFIFLSKGNHLFFNFPPHDYMLWTNVHQTTNDNWWLHQWTWHQEIIDT